MYEAENDIDLVQRSIDKMPEDKRIFIFREDEKEYQCQRRRDRTVVEEIDSKSVKRLELLMKV
jgi:hypothetical protein